MPDAWYYGDMKYFTNFFLRIEDRARSAFEHFPFFHAFLAGVGVVLFWRGVWETADYLRLAPSASIVIGVLLLGAIGLYLQTFVGNTIIIKQVEKEKAMSKKTEKEVTEVKAEVREGEITMEQVIRKLDAIEAKVTALSVDNK